jgi:hypothetical protein
MWHTIFHLGGRTSKFGLNNYIEYRNYCDNTVAINEIDGYASPKLYPNPVNAVAHLILNAEVTDASISICNATGKMVQQMDRLMGSEFKIDCKDLSSGFYVIQLYENGTLITTEKLVVVKD